MYLRIKETISKPELIEPNASFKIYKLPFDPAVPYDILKLLIADAYRPCARYVELSADYVRPAAGRSSRRCASPRT